MTTYDFICNQLENICPDAIPVMDEYLTAWAKDDEEVYIQPKYAEDLSTIIYPYLAAFRALTDVGVENAEKYIVDMRTKEVGN